ncbi:MAG: ATP-grasp domain-containing protein [Bacteroidales bacterium]|nr:ATP-grasp domain-containing protein [Bacteroidales bacterium]
MILIDLPYASDYLLEIIKENNYPVVFTEVAKKLVQDDSISWVPEEQAARYIRENPDTPLYTNSENALTWISDHLPDSSITKQADLFKDKFKFRELIRASHPDFHFRMIKLKDIPDLHPEELSFPFVIKPSVGFFSIGVYVVKSMDQWAVVQGELNPEKLKSIYPPRVLDTSVFIIEEYIEGEEFAIDCYFNQQGKAVILNILHHQFSSGADTSDRVYTTSLEIVLKNKTRFENFLQSIGNQSGLKNFPAHVEVRINNKGLIIPIEINPLRFGGWCTTADLLGIATGISPYELYFRNEQPDWAGIFKGRETKKYSIIVLNNNSGYPPEVIDHFNFDLLRNDFENPLLVREFDANKYSVFGFVFAETSLENDKEVNNILVSDLRKYITLK